MKKRTALNSILVATIIGYVITIGITGSPFLFILLFYIALLFTILLCIINIRNKKHLIIILGCLCFFFISAWAINHYFLPDKFHPISLLGDVGIGIFTMFLGWNLIKPCKKGIVYIGTTVFIGFIVFLTVISSITQSDESSSIGTLQSLPYLSYVVEDKATDKDGVVNYHQALSNQGINLYHSFLTAGAHLMDMTGNILHTWLPEESDPNWEYVAINNNGDLFVSVQDIMLMKLDWDSHIQWEKNMRSHHDIALADNGDIYTLSRKDELVFLSGLPVPILNDYLVVLSPDGETKKEISLFQVLKRKIPVDRVFHIYAHILNPQNLWKIIEQKMEGRYILRQNTPFDILHNNTVTIIDRDMNGLYKKGNIFISVRELDLIGIVDIEQEKLLWSWGPGNLDRQHHPTLLANGNILIFDNGRNREYSRVIEIVPLTKEIVWKYETNPSTSFFSHVMGAAQRLPNGNTLITESTKGYVFEVTKDGEIVWEFYNPDREKDGKRIRIYRMMRITDLKNYPKLKELQQHLRL
jgi:hypothetical protein